jgi:IS605 OrfB family transposase
VGINTLATASIVCPDGTVLARKFIHPASDIDRRDKQANIIRQKARKTKTLHRGFAKTPYRKAKGINANIAQQVSRRIVNFALEHGASTIVFEDLKGWRPKGGRKRSNLKQKFHGWLHRRLVTLTEQKFQEEGGKVEYVYARGTSSWAFDGSGKVQRSKTQYEIATFATGKRYNADLGASYNIAARYLAYKLKLTRRKDGQVAKGRSSCATPRMPVTLSLLWDWEAAYEREAS